MQSIKTSIQALLRIGLVSTVILLALGSLLHVLGLEQASQLTLLLGVWALMLTPILRVLISLIFFYQEKDRLYMAITLLVLVIIALSIVFA
ncbi:DUF1634 domain-containing protein [Streptococcus danieliae]|uniref:DUF1634 domain-containing protein n=1 Tax=Streptococcus danieliae TaxID=747656 RepID=A0A7Z0LD84_9STRE|nr:DUF1634 domain-containing protein [Streptococcus danieliae]MBF0717400.1 DUF1634 domain-containing protein [Streptococcus danieliae]NYS49330.1 DUF1634 domain-containing protein [Streptococcus danieliae]